MSLRTWPIIRRSEVSVIGVIDRPLKGGVYSWMFSNRTVRPRKGRNLRSAMECGWIGVLEPTFHICAALSLRRERVAYPDDARQNLLSATQRCLRCDGRSIGLRASRMLIGAMIRIRSLDAKGCVWNCDDPCTLDGHRDTSPIHPSALLCTYHYSSSYP